MGKNKLATLRREKRITQQEMARVLGVTQAGYNYYENEPYYQFKPWQIQKIADFLGVPYEVIENIKEDKDENKKEKIDDIGGYVEDDYITTITKAITDEVYLNSAPLFSQIMVMPLDKEYLKMVVVFDVTFDSAQLKKTLQQYLKTIINEYNAVLFNVLFDHEYIKGFDIVLRDTNKKRLAVYGANLKNL